MANDRIFLTCKFCDEYLLLLKYYPVSSYVPTCKCEIEEFMRKHLAECHPNAHGFDLAYEPGFVLETEQPKHWKQFTQAASDGDPAALIEYATRKPDIKQNPAQSPESVKDGTRERHRRLD